MGQSVFLAPAKLIDSQSRVWQNGLQMTESANGYHSKRQKFYGNDQPVGSGKTPFAVPNPLNKVSGPARAGIAVAVAICSVAGLSFGAGRLARNNPGGSPLAGFTGLLSGTGRVAKGVKPSSYKGPEIDLRRAEVRARNLYDLDKFFARAGTDTPWIKTLPESHAHYKNGFMDLLRNGDTKLSTVQVESAREAIVMFVNYDDRTNLDKLQGQLETLTGDKKGEFVARNIYEVSRDALAYVGIDNPSKEMDQYAWGIAAKNFGDANGQYDLATGKAQNDRKR